MSDSLECLCQVMKGVAFAEKKLFEMWNQVEIQEECVAKEIHRLIEMLKSGTVDAHLAEIDENLYVSHRNPDFSHDWELTQALSAAFHDAARRAGYTTKYERQQAANRQVLKGRIVLTSTELPPDEPHLTILTTADEPSSDTRRGPD